MPTAEIDEPRGALRARPQSTCFACGRDNPTGLHLRFEAPKTGEVEALWTPGAAWEGFRGIVHGGIVSTVLDEAMSKAAASAGCEALTAELRVRFRRHVASGGAFRVRAWIARRKKRLIETEAVLIASDGAEHAHAWAAFLSLERTPPQAPATECS